jgi:hypothetical protein
MGTLLSALAMMVRRRPAAQTSSATPIRLFDLVPAGLAAFMLAAVIAAVFYSYSIGPLIYASLFALWSLAGAVIAWGAPSLELDARVIAIALAGIAIHLLGAGGIRCPAYHRVCGCYLRLA